MLFCVRMTLMADSIPQKDENIVIRTMKSDLEKLSGKAPEKEKKPESVSIPPVSPISREARAPVFQMPAPLPPAPPKPAVPPPVSAPKVEPKPPVLVIPPKKIAEIPAKPLFKVTPTWLKIGGIGLGILLLVLFGMYGYWKIFIQSQPEVPTQAVTTMPPTLPTTPIATTTAPIKFFNKLPNKEVTIEISSKTSASLIKALKSEAAMEESRGAVKQVKVTYQGKPITVGEFLDLMLIFAPQNFLQNYESEFAFAFFSQKEGVRPILILKAKNKTEMETQMKDWEVKTLASDIFPLFLNSSQIPKISLSFKSYLFIGQPVRYLNVNMSFASLNYAIYNNFLIFTTSSAGMFVILQDLTGQNVSQNYLENLKASINEFVK